MYRPVPESVRQQLAEGKFIPIHKLLRAPQSSPHTDKGRHETNIGGGIIVSTAPAPKTRAVQQPLDWFEAFLSTLLPFEVQKLQLLLAHPQSASMAEASGIQSDAAIQQAEKVQRLVCFGLSAAYQFGHSTFDSALAYLESHRQDCTEQRGRNIAEPNMTAQGQLLLHQVRSSASAARSSSSSGSSGSSSSYGRSNGTYSGGSGSGSSSRGFGSPRHDDCGPFNSRDGCSKSAAACGRKHECRLCKSAEHGKASCPQFAPRYGKNGVAPKSGTRTQPAGGSAGK
jgi:hypothetical protein